MEVKPGTSSAGPSIINAKASASETGPSNWRGSVSVGGSDRGAIPLVGRRSSDGRQHHLRLGDRLAGLWIGRAPIGANELLRSL